jgi:heme exporter protein D
MDHVLDHEALGRRSQKEAHVNTTPRSRWDQRRFVSLGVLFAGLALPISGLGDHFARHSSGPHADFGWVVAHAATGSLFVVLATWHAVLNRRALLKYLRSRTARPALPSLEALAALALVGGTLALTVGR